MTPWNLETPRSVFASASLSTCLTIHANHPGRLTLSQPVMLDQDNRPTPKLFLRRTTDAANISSVHGRTTASIR